MHFEYGVFLCVVCCAFWIVVELLQCCEVGYVGGWFVCACWFVEREGDCVE